MRLRNFQRLRALSVQNGPFWSGIGKTGAEHGFWTWCFVLAVGNPAADHHSIGAFLASLIFGAKFLKTGVLQRRFFCERRSQISVLNKPIFGGNNFSARRNKIQTGAFFRHMATQHERSPLMNISSTSKKIGEKIDDVSSQVSDSAAALADSAVREGKNLQNSAAHSASEIADIVIAKLKGAGLNTDTLISQAKDHASNIQNSIESEIRARPLRTLGYAALAGIVFGLFASR